MNRTLCLALATLVIVQPAAFAKEDPNILDGRCTEQERLLEREKNALEDFKRRLLDGGLSSGNLTHGARALLTTLAVDIGVRAISVTKSLARYRATLQAAKTARNIAAQKTLNAALINGNAITVSQAEWNKLRLEMHNAKLKASVTWTPENRNALYLAEGKFDDADRALQDMIEKYGRDIHSASSQVPAEKHFSRAEAAKIAKNAAVHGSGKTSAFILRGSRFLVASLGAATLIDLPGLAKAIMNLNGSGATHPAKEYTDLLAQNEKMIFDPSIAEDTALAPALKHRNGMSGLALQCLAYRESPGHMKDLEDRAFQKQNREFEDAVAWIIGPPVPKAFAEALGKKMAIEQRAVADQTAKKVPHQIMDTRPSEPMPKLPSNPLPDWANTKKPFTAVPVK